MQWTRPLCQVASQRQNDCRAVRNPSLAQEASPLSQGRVLGRDIAQRCLAARVARPDAAQGLAGGRLLVNAPRDWLTLWADGLATYELAERIGREYGVDAWDVLAEAHMMLKFADAYGRLPTPEEEP
jgi:hypothetical protein